RRRHRQLRPDRACDGATVAEPASGQLEAAALLSYHLVLCGPDRGGGDGADRADGAADPRAGLGGLGRHHRHRHGDRLCPDRTLPAAIGATGRGRGKGSARRRNMKLDTVEARKALADIDDIVRRVRQSQIYDLSSRIMIWWGVMVLVGNLANWFVPRQ